MSRRKPIIDPNPVPAELVDGACVYWNWTQFGDIPHLEPGEHIHSLYHGRMEGLLPSLPDGRFDAIITDPPYARKWWPFYQYILDQADRLLRPGGYLLILCPHMMFDPSAQALFIRDGSTMSFRWPLMMNQAKGGHARLCNAKRNIRVRYKGIGWWIKEPADRDYSEVVDSFDNEPPRKGFNWEQSPTWARYCLGMLKPGSVVLDPMAGHGVLHLEALRLGHRPVSCEPEPERVAEIMARIAALKAETS